MSTKEKLIKRFKTLPKDFTWDELVRLLGYFGYEHDNKGKTSGSRVRFYNCETQRTILVHKPHTSGDPVKRKTLQDVYNRLESLNLID